MLESVFRHKVDPHAMFSLPAVDSVNVAGGRRRSTAPPLTLPLLRRIVSSKLSGFDGVVWTYNMRRMAVLVEQALRFAEPVLLVGETGCVAVFSLASVYCAPTTKHVLHVMVMSCLFVCLIIHLSPTRTDRALAWLAQWQHSAAGLVRPVALVLNVSAIWAALICIL